MSNYKGKKTNKSIKFLVQERVRYKTGAFNNTVEEPKNVVDFNFAEKQFYGRVNPKMEPIIANPQALARYTNKGNLTTFFSVQNFVKEPLTLLVNKMHQAASLGFISPSDTYFYNFKIFKAYENPISLYETYMNNRLLKFNQKHLNSNIENYGEWVDKYLEEAHLLGPNFPSLFSSFQRSRRSNIFTSGLDVSIADEDCDDDSIKEEAFINSDVFDYYLNVAKQFGFSVNQNAPWILVADLNSPAMTLYKENLDLSSTSHIFSKNYLKCYPLDVQYLKAQLEMGYREYIKLKPYTKKLETRNHHIKYNIKYLNNINIIKYNNLYYNRLYIDLKNIEEYYYLTDADVERAKEKATFFAKKLDNSTAIDYINRQFSGAYSNRPGGLNDIVTKQNKKSEE